MLISKVFYNYLKDISKVNTVTLFDIIHFFFESGRVNKGVYIPENIYYDLLTNTLFAIRYFDDESGKKYRDILIEIIKEL